MAAAGDLTTLADIKAWLGRTDSNSDSQLSALITRASRQILTDLQLLNNYFTKHADSLTESQKLAIAGVAEMKNVTVAAGQAGRNPADAASPARLGRASG